MASNTCPSNSLQSFPANAGFVLTESSYKNAKKFPLSIQFTWGVRDTAPNFSYANSGEVDHIVNDTSTSTTYNGIFYSLASIQITQPTHNAWIVPTTLEVTKASNVEDIILTYQIDTFTEAGINDPKFIILVNPILRIDSAIGNPLYLTNLANSVSGPVTLEGLFPYHSGKNYIYYTTCVPGISIQDAYKNILVLLNTAGSLVSNSVMVKIKNLYGKFSQGDYPNYIPLANFKIPPTNNMSTVTNIEAFTTEARVDNPASGADDPVSSVQAFNSMKCVPFDPEKNLTKDGTIVIDTTTGTPFTLNPNITVARKRDILAALKNLDGSFTYPNAAGLTDETVDSMYLQILPDTARTISKNYFTSTHTGVIPFTKVEKVLGTFCAIICVVILVLLFIATMGYVQNDSSVMTRMWPIIEFFIFNVGLFVGGFIVGYFTIPAKCPDNTSFAGTASSGSGSGSRSGSVTV